MGLLELIGFIKDNHVTIRGRGGSSGNTWPVIVEGVRYTLINFFTKYDKNHDGSLTYIGEDGVLPAKANW